MTERGVTFGYNNLVVDMRAFPILRGLGHPVIYDVTHSLQLPGGGDGVTAGQAEFIEPLASAGIAAGVDGVFLEVHERPEQAKSDAQNALRLDLLEPLIGRLLRHPRHRTGIAADSRRTRAMTPEHRHRPRARAQGPADGSGGDPRSRRSCRCASSSAPSSSCATAAAVSSSPAWASPASSAGRSRPRSRAPGTPAFFLHPAEAIHGDIGAIREDDVVLALSQSGETEELLRLLESIRRLGARLIAISGHPSSTLARAADVTLNCGVAAEACPLNLAPTASTTAALALGDALAMTAARPQGLSRGGFRLAAPGRKARTPADARRERHALGRRGADRAGVELPCATSSTRCPASVSA